MYFDWHLQEKADIRDADGAKPLKLDGGGIQFDNVYFRCTLNSLLGNSLGKMATCKQMNKYRIFWIIMLRTLADSHLFSAVEWYREISTMSVVLKKKKMLAGENSCV